MGNPIGVRLKDAVEILARKLGESAGVPLPADAPMVMAEAIESGVVVASYRESRGIRPLDTTTWHSPAWRRYFEVGTVELVLPLLDANERPNPQGLTVRCNCEIFVRRDSLGSLTAKLEPASVPATG